MAEYTLNTPIVLGEETIEVLQLEEPTVGSLEKHNVDLSETALTTVRGMKGLVCACVSNATEAHINKMKLKDLTGVVGVCASFFE